MITVSILWPSGIGPGDLSLRVMYVGHDLELTVQWPQALTDFSIMHKKWLNESGPDNMELYHPKFLGFEASLKKCREHKTDLIESVARFPTLPCSGAHSGPI